MSVQGKVRRHRKQKTQSPVWKGPEEDGITQSLLSRFLVCRERFRLLMVEGLATEDEFSHPLEFGNLWHIAEEAYAAETDWVAAIKEYARELCVRYPLKAEEVDKWYNVVKIQFPVYVVYWKNHPDVKNRKPVLQEESFAVPYTLPSGRVVTLRGKFDSVDIIKRNRKPYLFLQENKTKGDIKEEMIARQLSFDLQTMLYLVALDKLYTEEPGIPGIGGVRYNVVRRPLSGGKGSIRRHKPSKSNPQGESKEHFYKRLKDDYIVKEPEYWFMRWTVAITKKDRERFCKEFLDPVLEQLCDWWEWICIEPDNPFRGGNNVHWRHPFGVYNPLNEGRASDLDAYLESGSMVGLRKVDDLFPELD